MPRGVRARRGDTAAVPGPSPETDPADLPAAAPRLRGLLVAQFCGAFNDNAFKMLVVLLAMAALPAGDEAGRQRATMFGMVALTLPLLLFSLPAMALGDRVGKRRIVLWTKAAEVVLMALGTLAFALAPSGWLPLVVLAGMGAQSALFAPAKYGILPELLPHDRLAEANGRLEAASFLAIILGTACAGPLLAAVGGEVWVAGAVLTAFAVAGFVAAVAVPAVPASGAAAPFGVVVRGAWAAIRGDRALWLATLGTVVFWTVASLLGQDVLVYGKQVLGFGDELAGLPYALFAVGVGAGALLAGRLARGKVDTGQIPLGAIGLAVGVGAMGLIEPGRALTLLLMFGLGLASGFVVVPLNALVQWRAPAARRGAVIALVNGLSFAGILGGAFLCTGLAELGLGSAAILLVAALATAAGTAWAVWLLPEALLRSFVLLAAHTLYRVRVLGARHVPESGGALLVPNHVSFLDGLFLLAAIDRPIRFVVDQYWYERPYLKPFLRALRAIPISASGGPRVVLRALRDAGQALDDGELVCLFAEGEISRMGSTLPFRRGLQRIVKGRRAPVVPVHLDRVYGGLLSPRQGRVRWWPTQVPCPVTVSFGAPADNTIAPEELRRRVDALGERAWRLRARELRPLHHAFVRTVRRAPWRRALADTQGRRLSRLGALAAAVVLARRLRAVWTDQPRIGILLPPSIGGALAAIATSLAGRVAVPLNYTVGAAALASAVRQAGVRSVVTSRAFRDRLPLELPTGLEVVALEDLLGAVTRRERWSAALRALLAPIAWLERACGAPRRVVAGDLAVVIFSSGSTGEPKGVELLHANVQANCEATAQVIPLDRHDRLVGVLPLFHSFGNMALWYGLQQGAGIVFHPNPLDAAAVGELVARHAATILVATPTFLQLYHRRCEPGQFGSLRVVLTGAEKLTDALADAFADRFGIRPVQGYGCTECAPVVAVSTPGYRAPGFYQAGSRRGAVGRPLPGVVVSIVDPETRQPLPLGASGLVLVRGPNVMRGYLGRDDLTAAAMHDGSYVTGDIGYVDEEGFLFLTDRQSRFSKIGGEMVPHGTVEEHLQACSGLEERAFAVCGVPDDKKGERLMVLTTLEVEALQACLRQLATRGLPPLFVPRADQFVRVAALPVLGTGKLDLRAVRELCLQVAGRAPS
ncbi:MAG: MFS transporter [Planctomycetes bacterium]|nr:MFS transporter [Planctomycetota bacterium]